LLKNYRPISLISVIAKLFTRTISNRIETTIEREQGREQAGFRAGFSTTEHILSLCELIERSKEYRMPLYICFVDFEKAFDSVEMNALWNSLQRQGVHPKLIRLLRSFYLQAKNEFRVNIDQLVEVKIARGVRQGDPISPKLFNASLEDVFRRLDWDSGGLNINGQYLTHLRFADDIALISGNLEELQQRLQELSEEAAGSGLKINEDKTELMCNAEEDAQCQLTLNGKTIRRSKTFTYLGRQVSMPLDMKSELMRRVKAGWFAFSKMKTYLTARGTPMRHKRSLHDQVILPAMLYACESWSPTASDLQYIAVAQRRIERRMARKSLRDRITNDHLRRITGALDVVEAFRRRKSIYAWNVARMNPERWTPQLMNWHPWQAKRGRGRPSRRWQDDLRQKAGGRNWMRVARDLSQREWILL
jgi:Reverse transcriptase (RNA-dependent DNA polymerase)